MNFDPLHDGFWSAVLELSLIGDLLASFRFGGRILKTEPRIEISYLDLDLRRK